MKILGIDEAGRGPIVGPMVIAGFMCNEQDIPILKDIGVRDSKDLSRKERERIFEEVISKFKDYYYITISPQIIDYYVYKRKLNYLEIENMVKIISKLNPDKVYIDSPSRNIKRIKELIEKSLNNKIEIIVDIKADKKYEVVSAASIIAKVIRDREIDNIKEKTKIDFGSGYPADEKTINAIKENYELLENYIRKSWSTLRRINNQKSIREFFK